MNTDVVGLDGCGLRMWLRRRHAEQLAGAHDAGCTIAVGEQTVVSDAMEALRQHVQQEAPDELAGASVIVFQRSGPSSR